MSDYKILLSESEIPTSWYNVAPDLPVKLEPPLNPRTKQPAGPEDLTPIFPMELIKQEVSQERFIDIPDEVREMYKLYRPTPLIRARRLEKALDTPAKIYYKYEGVSPVGSHKANTAIPQAYYNKQAGIKRLSTETGAGQWGCALAMACNFFGMECTVYMVKVSYEQKPYRRSMMEVFGADVYASPTTLTQTGRTVLENDPDTPGSLGIAISEAVEDAAGRDDTNYSLGSVLNHVLLHQTVIGEEAIKQMEKAGVMPDIVVACAGGGSNFAGIGFPFLKKKIEGREMRIIAVEPAACPTLTKGKYAYDFGDEAGFTPLLKMFTLGHDFVPPGIHAGGLRYHGMSTLISACYQGGLIEATSVQQTAVFEAAIRFARAEGIIPAPESAHAIRTTIDEALKCKEEGTEKNILFNLSGHGFFDMTSYDKYLACELEDYEYPKESIDEALHHLPKV